MLINDFDYFNELELVNLCSGSIFFDENIYCTLLNKTLHFSELVINLVNKVVALAQNDTVFCFYSDYEEKIKNEPKLWIDKSKTNEWVFWFIDFLYDFSHNAETFYLKNYYGLPYDSGLLIQPYYDHLQPLEDLVDGFADYRNIKFDYTDSSFYSPILVNSMLNILNSAYNNNTIMDLSLITVYWTEESPITEWIMDPFVASPSNQYYDVWFQHILIYFYWLWFIFIYLIIFFLNVLMWEIDYNLTHNNPQRETRGVSRSKCGDFITSIVPITWATSIIIHESTDTIDNFDGYGTLDFAIGIRAYQWGWEYYYPNSLEIKCNFSTEKSIEVGNYYSYQKNSYNLINDKTNKNVILGKKNEESILPIFLITDNSLNKEFFNINNMKNFGFGKLCIYTAYKFTLNNKAINYSNILSSSSNLTNFNSKKFLSKYLNKYGSNQINNNKDNLLSNKNVLNFKRKYFNSTDIQKLLNYNIKKEFFEKKSYENNLLLKKLNLFNRLYISKNCNLFFLNNYYYTLNNKKININNLDYDYIILLTKNINFISNFSNFSNILISKINKNTLLFINQNLENLTILDNYTKLNTDYFYFSKRNYVKDIIIQSKVDHYSKFYNISFNFVNLYSEIEFKRLVSNDILEDLYWNFYCNEDNIINNYENTESSSNNSLFVFKHFGNYENDLMVLFKSYNLFNNWNLIEDNGNVYNLFESLYINNLNLNLYNLQNINLFSKMNILLESSFLNYKNNNHYFNNNNYSNYSNYFKFSNIIASNLLFSSLQSYNYTDFYNNNYININTKNITNLDRLSNNSSLNINIKVIKGIINSIWKIHKFVVYDNRSFFNVESYWNLNLKLPFINQYKQSEVINKNTNYFIDTFFLKRKTLKYSNIFKSKLTNNGTLFSYDLPFSLSSESDSIRYSWLDWYILYSKRQAKAQDLIQYNLNGSKLFLNKYDYVFKDSNELNILDNYYSRLLINKKNYTNLYNFIPYILLKNKNNFYTWGLDYFTSNLLQIEDKCKLNIIIKYMYWFDKSLSIQINKSLFNSLNSIYTNNKNFFFLRNNYSNYYFFISSLSNILIKRNFLYKHLLLNNVNSSLYSNYNYNISNQIILDWKSTIFCKKNIENSLENLQNFNLTHYLNFKKVEKILNFNYYNFNFFVYNNSMLSLNYDKLSNVVYYLSNISKEKNQYNSMRKSIPNMIRIQSDKSVCMPTDTRIQLLTWSKDIIHSWAIPAAGLKIDCIPGYSSHKSFNLALNGLYYGQCMEICGRFHHWMPITVYFVRRDMFVLWCNHFLNNNKKENLKSNTNQKKSRNSKNVSNF